jgi:hypothetical protein
VKPLAVLKYQRMAFELPFSQAARGIALRALIGRYGLRSRLGFDFLAASDEKNLCRNPGRNGITRSLWLCSHRTDRQE